MHLNINLNPKEKEKEKQPSTNQMTEYLFKTVIISLEINQNNIWRVINSKSIKYWMMKWKEKNKYKNPIKIQCFRIKKGKITNKKLKDKKNLSVWEFFIFIFLSNYKLSFL